MSAARATVLLAAALLTLVLIASSSAELDRGFGSGGKVLTDFGQNEVVQGLAVQRDGKIVAAGITQDQTTFATQFALARYAGNGSPDASFGVGGKVTTGFGGSENRAFAVALTSDGKIVAAGGASSGSVPGWPTGTDFALARYNPDGSLDTSFGNGGKVLTDFGFTHDGAQAIVIQPDDKIVVAGSTRPFGPFETNPPDFALARYNPNGTLDPSFDGDGKVTTGFRPGSSDRINALALAPDGKIVAAGFGGLARYNGDGRLDPSFGAAGKVVLEPGGQDWAFGVVVQPDAKVVVAGSLFAGAVLARYAADGSVDSSFGEFGFAFLSFSFGPRRGGVQALARQPDGKLVVAGYIGPDSSAAEPDDFAFTVDRFDSGGRFDRSFSIPTHFGTTTWDEARALALQPNGRIIAGGLSAAIQGHLPVNGDFALARYLPPSPLCRVPNVRGKTLAAARKSIRGAHCSVGRIRYVRSKRTKGRVLAQRPRPGTSASNRYKVNLVVSRGSR